MKMIAPTDPTVAASNRIMRSVTPTPIVGGGAAAQTSAADFEKTPQFYIQRESLCGRTSEQNACTHIPAQSSGLVDGRLLSGGSCWQDSAVSSVHRIALAGTGVVGGTQSVGNTLSRSCSNCGGYAVGGSGGDEVMAGGTPCVHGHA